MSWKLKIALGLSILWMTFWFFVYYVVFARDPAALVIFILGNPILLGIIWGLYFGFREKKPGGLKQENLLSNIVDSPVKGSFKNPMGLYKCYLWFYVGFPVVLFIFYLIFFLVSKSSNTMPYEFFEKITNIIYPLVGYVIFLLWVYRTNKNAHLLGASQMVYSPAQSVLWLVIPFIGFFGNYYVIKELWKASKNPVASLWKNDKNPLIVKLRWWLMFLFFIFFSPLAAGFLHQGDVGYAGAIYFLGWLPYLIITIIIVNKISRMQLLHYKNIATANLSVR